MYSKWIYNQKIAFFFMFSNPSPYYGKEQSTNKGKLENPLWILRLEHSRWQRVRVVAYIVQIAFVVSGGMHSPMFKEKGTNWNMCHSWSQVSDCSENLQHTYLSLYISTKSWDPTFFVFYFYCSHSYMVPFLIN